MRSNTYKDLNDVEEWWLRSKRSKLADKYKSKKQKALKDGNLNIKKLLEDLRREAENAEKNIKGIGKNKHLKKFVNDAGKKNKALIEKQAKVLKNVGIGSLIAGSSALGIAGAVKMAKNSERNKTIRSTKEQILKD